MYGHFSNIDWLIDWLLINIQQAVFQLYWGGEQVQQYQNEGQLRQQLLTAIGFLEIYKRGL